MLMHRSRAYRMTPATALLAAAALGTCCVSLPVRASVVGSDDSSASAYDAPGNWQNGDDGSITGNAFGPWTLSASGTAGFFIGSSTNISNPGANINSSEGTSFGMFGQGLAEAFRSFNGGGLTLGQAFSLDIAVNFRNGGKGIDLRNSSNANVFNFNVGGDDYRVNGVSIGSTYSSNTAFHLTFTQTSVSGGTWTVARSGGVTDFDSGTYTGIPTNFKLYIHSTDMSGSPNDLMTNNFLVTVVPEASPIALLSLLTFAGLSASLYCRRRRRKSLRRIQHGWSAGAPWSG
jgi:hypothetical protein